MKPFEDARRRLERAKLHGHRLSDMWNAIPNEDLYSIKPRVDLQGNGTIRLVKVQPIPEEFSLLLGEMLYQLRSALDSALYQATIYATGKNPPPGENKLEFPICHNAKEFPGLAKRRLSALPQVVQNGIEHIQPYNAMAATPEDMVKSIPRSLGILNDLARKDRHRKLHVVGSYAIELAPAFTLPEGVTITQLDVNQVGFLEDDNELASFSLDGFVWGMNVTVNPFLATTIGLNEPPPPCHPSDTFAQRLIEMINAVHSVITAFENYF